MSMATHIGMVVFGYLLGSVPVGVVVGRLLYGVDPRTAGSRNIGATNVTRVAGRKAGLITLAGDILKGTLPVVMAMALGLEPLWVALSGFSAFVGHLFPLFLGFKGGKGVATACGMFLPIVPLPLLISALVFAGLVAVTRYVSVGSMTASVALPLFIYLTGGNREYVWIAVVVSLLVIIKHRDNIERLLRGEENRFSLSEKRR